MKKFLIPCICLISVSVLAGCSNTGDSKTITALNNQLSNVENIVKSTSVDEIAEVSPSVTLSSNEPYNSIQSFRALSNENMLREEEIRQKILNMNSVLKSHTSTKLKLTPKKSNALKSITNNLGKYSAHLNETKTRVKNSVNKIKKNLKVSNINIEEATSSYTTLNSSMNERYAYLTNIYDNLEQVCILLDCPCGNECCDQNNCNNCNNYSSEPNDYQQENTPYFQNYGQTSDNFLSNQKQENEENQKGSFKIVKNIDSYSLPEDNASQNNQTPKESTTIQNQQIQPETQNIPRFPINTTAPLPNQPHQPLPRPYPHGNLPNNFGYGGYGYNYGYNQINPNRNTDTFYSLNRNIDTYRYSPNFYNYNFTY